MKIEVTIEKAEMATKLFRELAGGEYFKVTPNGCAWMKMRPIEAECNRGNNCVKVKDGEQHFSGSEVKVHPLLPPKWDDEPELVRFEKLPSRGLFKFTGEFEPDGIWMRSSSGSACRMDGGGEQVSEVNCALLVKPLNGKLCVKEQA